MIDNLKKCPECGNNNIYVEENHHFNGTIVDYTCKDCRHSWSHYIDKK